MVQNEYMELTKLAEEFDRDRQDRFMRDMQFSRRMRDMDDRADQCWAALQKTIRTLDDATTQIAETGRRLDELGRRMDQTDKRWNQLIDMLNREHKNGGA